MFFAVEEGNTGISGNFLETDAEVSAISERQVV